MSDALDLDRRPDGDVAGRGRLRTTRSTPAAAGSTCRSSRSTEARVPRAVVATPPIGFHRTVLLFPLPLVAAVQWHAASGRRGFELGRDVRHPVAASHGRRFGASRANDARTQRSRPAPVGPRGTTTSARTSFDSPISPRTPSTVLNTMLDASSEAVTLGRARLRSPKLRADFAAPGQRTWCRRRQRSERASSSMSPGPRRAAARSGHTAAGAVGPTTPTRPIRLEAARIPRREPARCVPLGRPSRSGRRRRHPVRNPLASSSPPRAGWPHGRGLRALLPGGLGPRRPVRRLVRDGGDLDPHLLPPELPGPHPGASQRPLLPELRRRTTGRIPRLQTLPPRRIAGIPGVERAPGRRRPAPCA